MDWTQILAIVILVVLAICAKLTVAKFGRSAKKTGPPKYRIRGPLLSAAERSFYGVLKQAIENSFDIHAKVRIADILTPVKGNTKSAWQQAFNRISAKHFDFVLCKPETLEVVAVIELNDSSHKAKSRASRDEFVSSACESAKLRLIMFPARSSYSVAEIRGLVLNETQTAEVRLS